MLVTTPLITKPVTPAFPVDLIRVPVPFFVSIEIKVVISLGEPNPDTLMDVKHEN